MNLSKHYKKFSSEIYFLKNINKKLIYKFSVKLFSKFVKIKS